MKIAIVTDDEKTISAHFGRAKKYVVISVENGKIAGREVRERVGNCQCGEEGQTTSHQHEHDSRGRGFGKHSEEKHQRMFSNIKDCDILVARGMGRGAQLGLEQTSIKPILTEISDIQLAVDAVIDGTIVDQPDRVH